MLKQFYFPHKNILVFHLLLNTIWYFVKDFFHLYLWEVLVCNFIFFLSVTSLSWFSVTYVGLIKWMLMCYSLLYLKKICITYFLNAAAAAAKSLQSYPTLCNPIDSSPPGSSIPGILQARTLEWVAIFISVFLK